MEQGVIRLENTEKYPFNNSARLVALAKEQPGTDYPVLTELLSSDGAVGDICVTGKAVNGFQIAYTGSASYAEIRYTVMEACV